MASEARDLDLRTDPEVRVTVDELIHELRPLGRPTAVPAPALASASTVAGRSHRRFRGIPPPKRAVVVRSCVSLGVLLGIALPQWPYEHGCGWGLGFYLFAVGVLLTAGLWCLLMSWKSRLPFSHTIALGTLIWGLALTAHVVMPRVGYAKTQAAWTCGAQ